MPIRKELRKLYPANWKELRSQIMTRAGGRCEGSPAFPDCRATNYEPHPVTGSRVVLTTAHLDHDPTNNDPSNLKALCQRCHNKHDAKHRHASRKARLAEQARREDIWPHQQLNLLDRRRK